MAYSVFAGPRLVTRGELREVLPVLKERFEADRSEMLLVFDVETGQQVDFDLRGSIEEIIARVEPPRGPGRPKLGVTSREVTLLPRHWEWLEAQPSGISATLRKLVEAASKADPGKARARAMKDGLCRFLSAMAGNRPNYEEAVRALYAGETDRFEELVARWPKDIREHAVERARLAASGG